MLARLASVILAGKRDSRRRRHCITSFSENVEVAEQIMKCWKFYHFAIWRASSKDDRSANFSC